MVTTAVAAVAGAVPPPRKAQSVTVATAPPPTLTRRQLLAAVATASTLRTAAASAAAPRFAEIPGSGGVKSLDLREGSGEIPAVGDQVAIHYYGRLAAKQGWRFDSTYDHKDETGDPMPFVFTLGSGKVIPGMEAAVKSMRVGGLRRVIIPPSQGYQNTSQEPVPPNFFDRQRLFTTIFNPTRLANGEGSTLGTLIFDIELINIRSVKHSLLEVRLLEGNMDNISSANLDGRDIPDLNVHTTDDEHQADAEATPDLTSVVPPT